MDRKFTVGDKLSVIVNGEVREVEVVSVEEGSLDRFSGLDVIVEKVNVREVNVGNGGGVLEDCLRVVVNVGLHLFSITQLYN